MINHDNTHLPSRPSPHWALIEFRFTCNSHRDFHISHLSRGLGNGYLPVCSQPQPSISRENKWSRHRHYLRSPGPCHEHGPLSPRRILGILPQTTTPAPLTHPLACSDCLSSTHHMQKSSRAEGFTHCPPPSTTK